jgi:hypothetical protein
MPLHVMHIHFNKIFYSFQLFNLFLLLFTKFYIQYTQRQLKYATPKKLPLGETRDRCPSLNLTLPSQLRNK